MDESSVASPVNKEEELFEEMEETEGGGVAKTSFVRKLFELVNHEADDTVAFTEDGTAFEVSTQIIFLPKNFVARRLEMVLFRSLFSLTHHFGRHPLTCDIGEGFKAIRIRGFAKILPSFAFSKFC